MGDPNLMSGSGSGSMNDGLSTSIYLTHVDSQALSAFPSGKVSEAHERLRATLVLYALLAKRVVVPDGAAIYNPVLRDLLFDERYAHFGLREYLQDGTLAFAQRSAAPSFEEIDAFLRRDSAVGSEAPRDMEPYLAFLDEHSKVRVPYDYDLTAKTFTAGVEGCLEDGDIAAALALDGIAEEVLELMVRSRENAVEDGYSRRSFAYRIAEQLQQKGMAQSAENLRALASAVYHGAAAATIGVNPAYAAPFRSAAAAIHVVGLDTPIEEIVGEPDPLDRSLPFPTEALYIADAEIVREIRSGRDFKQFLGALHRTALMTDARRASSEFVDALLTYLGAIEEPLTLLAGGGYAHWQRLERRARVTRYASRVGAGVVTLSGVLVPEASVELAAFGIAWGFGGWTIQRFLDARMKTEVGRATARARRGDLVPQSSLPQAALRRS